MPDDESESRTEQVPLLSAEVEEFALEDEFPIEELEPIPPTPEQMRENVAKYLAIILVCGFLILIGLPLILFVNNPITLAGPIVTDLIKTESAVISGLVGAVVGYYYRVKSENA